MLFSYGGDLSAGSGRSRAGDTRRAVSCAQNGKWITSLAAIVASNQGDFGQGRVRCSIHRRVPLPHLDFFFGLFLRFPLPQ